MSNFRVKGDYNVQILYDDRLIQKMLDTLQTDEKSVKKIYSTRFRKALSIVQKSAKRNMGGLKGKYGGYHLNSLKKWVQVKLSFDRGVLKNGGWCGGWVGIPGERKNKKSRLLRVFEFGSGQRFAKIKTMYRPGKKNAATRFKWIKNDRAYRGEIPAGYFFDKAVMTDSARMIREVDNIVTDIVNELC